MVGGPGDNENAGAAWAYAFAPTLSISKTHSGSFTQGQQGATYTVVVSNRNSAGTGPTTGPVTMTETVPSGLTLVSMAGTGWNCSLNICKRGDALNPGSSYPSITVKVNVAANATPPQVNQVSVSGGGLAAVTATDSTNIIGSNPGRYDGAWVGTTAQSKALSFVILNNAFLSFSYGVHITGSGCTADANNTAFFGRTGLPLRGNTFSFSQSGGTFFSVTGSISPTLQATGSLTAGINPPGCTGFTQTTWNAHPAKRNR